ncbi:hypothetical protein KVP10_02730 [Candidimonas humi]|uniref:Bug family tripartite tricarboxylate transporter substrate binding protein n=1 Tax=Candidimonas humi TaxID=683355 RepID=A0ABV8NQU6_9BURK|nr:tripartite tricarboxylate transporter substrate-binding protein [Candidimonas humi]MBV6303783.1 hypothetical protein [Candidimonas humi]
MSFFTRTLTLAAAAGAAALLTTSGAQAAGYPDHPIHLYVPYGAGGSTDFVARLYAKKLAEQLHQNVIVENRPGAATNIGSDAAAKASPDGYTVLLSDGAHIWNSVFGPAPSFSPLKALVPIVRVASTPFVVAANPKAPFATAKDLLAAAKAQPGKYTISSASLRLFVELLNSRAGIKLLHIPYKGGALATSDAIAGQVNMVYAALPVLLPFIHSGKLRALAVTSRHRSTALPDVPSFAELGIDYDISIHYTIYAPAGVPAAVRQKLIQATQAISQEKDFRARLLASGTEADSNHPEQLEAEARRDLAMWQQVAKERPDLVELGK